MYQIKTKWPPNLYISYLHASLSEYFASFLHNFLRAKAKGSNLLSCRDTFSLSLVLGDTKSSLEDGRQVVRCANSAVGAFSLQSSQTHLQITPKSWELEELVTDRSAKIGLANVELMTVAFQTAARAFVAAMVFQVVYEVLAAPVGGVVPRRDIREYFLPFGFGDGEGIPDLGERVFPRAAKQVTLPNASRQ